MPSVKNHAYFLPSKITWWAIGNLDFNILFWGSVHTHPHVQCLLQLLYLCVQSWHMAHVLSKFSSAIDIPGMGLWLHLCIFQIGYTRRTSLYLVFLFPFFFFKERVSTGVTIWHKSCVPKSLWERQYLLQRLTVAGRPWRHSLSLSTSLISPTPSGGILPYSPVFPQSLNLLVSAYQVLE